MATYTTIGQVLQLWFWLFLFIQSSIHFVREVALKSPQSPLMRYHAALLACCCQSVSGFLYEKTLINKFSSESIFSAAYLGCFAGVFGILSYFYLQKLATSFHASLVFLIFPVIAISLESYIYGYSISLSSMFMTIPLLAGVLVILYPAPNELRDVNT